MNFRPISNILDEFLKDKQIKSFLKNQYSQNQLNILRSLAKFTILQLKTQRPHQKFSQNEILDLPQNLDFLHARPNVLDQYREQDSQKKELKEKLSSPKNKSNEEIQMLKDNLQAVTKQVYHIKEQMSKKRFQEDENDSDNEHAYKKKVQCQKEGKKASKDELQVLRSQNEEKSDIDFDILQDNKCCELFDVNRSSNELNINKIPSDQYQFEDSLNNHNMLKPKGNIQMISGDLLLSKSKTTMKISEYAHEINHKNSNSNEDIAIHSTFGMANSKMMPKNSLSPKRSRSKSNDLSSHNVKSALDHSTLVQLKNVSNKKQRKERSADKKDKKLLQSLSFEESQKNNIPTNNLQDTNYSQSYMHDRSHHQDNSKKQIDQSVQPQWWPESPNSKREDRPTKTRSKDNSFDVSNGNISHKVIKSSLSPRHDTSHVTEKGTKMFNVESPQFPKTTSPHSKKTKASRQQQPTVQNTNKKQKTPNPKAKYDAQLSSQSNVSRSPVAKKPIQPKEKKDNVNMNFIKNHIERVGADPLYITYDNADKQPVSVTKTPTIASKNKFLPRNNESVNQSNSVLNSSQQSKHSRRSPSNKVVSKIKDMVQSDRNRSRKQNQNVDIVTKDKENNLDYYQQLNQNTFNPGRIAENFLKSPFTEQIYQDDSQSQSNIDSIINKSKFLMSEGSSFQVRQPSYGKKKWDDQSEPEVLQSQTFMKEKGRMGQSEGNLYFDFDINSGQFQDLMGGDTGNDDLQVHKIQESNDILTSPMKSPKNF